MIPISLALPPRRRVIQNRQVLCFVGRNASPKDHNGRRTDAVSHRHIITSYCGFRLPGTYAYARTREKIFKTNLVSCQRITLSTVAHPGTMAHPIHQPFIAHCHPQRTQDSPRRQAASRVWPHRETFPNRTHRFRAFFFRPDSPHREPFRQIAMVRKHASRP